MKKMLNVIYIVVTICWACVWVIDTFWVKKVVDVKNIEIAEVTKNDFWVIHPEILKKTQCDENQCRLR